MCQTHVVGDHARVVVRSRAAGEDHEQLFDFLQCLTCDALALHASELKERPCTP